MTITIDPRVEERVRGRAEAEGLSVDAYIERLVDADRDAEEELHELALQSKSR
jgi:predicted HicB family RNase H-like nuclease